MLLESSRITSDSPINPVISPFNPTMIDAFPSCFSLSKYLSTLTSILFSFKNFEVLLIYKSGLNYKEKNIY